MKIQYIDYNQLPQNIIKHLFIHIHAYIYIYKKQQTSRMQKQNQRTTLLLAAQFLSKPLSTPINSIQLQQSLLVLETISKDILLKCNIDKLLIQRFYQIVKHNQLLFRMQEYLLLKIVNILAKMIQVGGYRDEELVVVVSAGVGLIRKCVPENQHKQKLKQVLILLRTTIEKILKQKTLKLEQIYPQLSSTLFALIQKSHITNHIITAHSLQIMGKVLQKIYENKNQKNTVQRIMNRKQQQHQQQQQQQQQIKSNDNFDQQCLLRLEIFFNTFVQYVWKLEFVYYQSVRHFVQRLWGSFKGYPTILCPLALLAEMVDAQVDYVTLPTSLQLQICHSFTQRFVNLLNTKPASKLENSGTLKQLQKLSAKLKPDRDQLHQIASKFTNRLYLIHNNKSLIVPNVLIGQSVHLIQLQGCHSFHSYPVGVSSLLEQFNFQCDRVLLSKIPYAETNLLNIHCLKRIASTVPSQAAHQLMQQLVLGISDEEGQYMIDMSLTKFCQFVTKILLLYWITVKPNFKIRPDLALSIFQTLNGCQAIRILKPSFEEEEILIGFTLLICYQCYTSIISDETGAFGEIKKLKLKLCMLEMVINNVHQQSYMVRTCTYYILLSLSAPESISQSLGNLQSTLINRNINNLQFLICLIKLCELCSTECEDLAQKFMQYNGSQSLLKILLPKLKTQTIRKCILSVSGNRAKWVNLLKGNTLLLYQRSIEQGETKSDQLDNFSMNDGPNVKVSNALGVLLLEIGDNWEHLLNQQSPYLDSLLDLLLELVKLDSKMVFFKLRFASIFKKLGQILLHYSIGIEQTHSSERKRTKIYKIFSLLPSDSYKTYITQIKRTKEQKEQEFGQKLVVMLRKQHKKYQLNYLMNSSNKEIKQIYEMSQNVISMLESSI